MNTEATTGALTIHEEKLSDETRAAISTARELIGGEIDTQRRQLEKAQAVLEATRITFDERDDEFTHARAADVLEVAIDLITRANENLDSVSLLKLWRKAGV